MDSDGVGIEHFRILHWNSRSVISKLDQLKHYISSCGVEIDIILLNETWLRHGTSIKLPGFQIFRQDSDRPHGGVAVAIKSKYCCSIIPTSSCYDFQNLLISVKLCSITIDILSVYIPPPPNGKFRVQYLNEAFSKISSRDFLIVGDFNAHSTSWGCRDSNRRGNIVNNFADNHNLVCLNDHTVTTIPPFGQEGNVLDLAFSSSSLSSSCSFSVADDPLSSYHFPIHINVIYNGAASSSDRSVVVPSEPIIHTLAEINFNKINWKEFHDLCTERFSDFNVNSEDPLLSYDDFIQKLSDILLTFSRKSYSCYTKKRKALIWWNDLCSQAVRSAKLAFESYKGYPTLENYILYKRFDAKKKRVLSEQKLLSWVKLCESFNRMTSSKIIWDYIQKFKFSRLNTSIKTHFLDNPSNALAYLDKIASSSNNLNSLDLQPYFYPWFRFSSLDKGFILHA
ncbi:endonuclease-reverse transcriptase domain-containing protein [Phthorimaea operculella]|nr:endonuclease-reverse transcriptase domain-containing protein [Phthorimaea operculella]